MNGLSLALAVNGKCYYASAVNYVLWGKMNRLCYEYFNLWNYQDAHEYSLQNATQYVREWKHLAWSDFGTVEEEAEEFTAYGFNGTPPSLSLPCKPSGSIMPSGILEWCWEPNQPRTLDPTAK